MNGKPCGYGDGMKTFCSIITYKPTILIHCTMCIFLPDQQWKLVIIYLISLLACGDIDHIEENDFHNECYMIIMLNL